MKASIAICTWNRAAMLRQTLNAMRRLEVASRVEWELLVVNNNCTDDTDSVLNEFSAVLPLRRLYEPTPGKSHAANLATHEARGELILWTDDDVLVDPNWLSEYINAAKQWPDAAFFGGTIEPWFETPPPRWIERHFRRLQLCYAIRSFGPDTRRIQEIGKDLPFGANMAVRRDVQLQYPFDGNLGPSTNDQVRGEETELLARMIRHGCTGVWVGSASVRHYIPRERLTERFVVDWYTGYGRMLCRQSKETNWPHLWNAPRWALRKYAQSWLTVTALRPFKNAAWLRALEEMGTWRGFIIETRVASSHLAACTNKSSEIISPLPLSRQTRSMVDECPR